MADTKIDTPPAWAVEAAISISGATFTTDDATGTNTLIASIISEASPMGEVVEVLEEATSHVLSMTSDGKLAKRIDDLLDKLKVKT